MNTSASGRGLRGANEITTASSGEVCGDGQCGGEEGMGGASPAMMSNEPRLNHNV